MGCLYKWALIGRQPTLSLHNRLKEGTCVAVHRSSPFLGGLRRVAKGDRGARLKHVSPDGLLKRVI